MAAKKKENIKKNTGTIIPNLHKEKPAQRETRHGA